MGPQGGLGCRTWSSKTGSKVAYGLHLYHTGHNSKLSFPKRSASDPPLNPFLLFSCFYCFLYCYHLFILFVSSFGLRRCFVISILAVFLYLCGLFLPVVGRFSCLLLFMLLFVVLVSSPSLVLCILYFLSHFIVFIYTLSYCCFSASVQKCLAPYQGIILSRSAIQESYYYYYYYYY